MKGFPSGLEVIPDFVTEDEERRYLEHVTQAEWNTSLKRRTQHYGFEYDYKSKTAAKKVTPLPEWTEELCVKLNPYFGQHPEQMIVNEYKPGQGIGAHIDKTDAFGPVIVSVSLGADIIMDLSHGESKIALPLPRRSALVLRDDARYKWYHAIASRTHDNGKPRTTRVSLTFRTMKKKKK